MPSRASRRPAVRLRCCDCCPEGQTTRHALARAKTRRATPIQIHDCPGGEGPARRPDMSKRDKLIVFDTTLRDGEQSPARR